MPLAEATIKSTKAAEKPRKLFDGGGLYLLIAPSGGKYWRLKYRFGGKEKSLSLGAYPEVTLGAARKLRDEARAFLVAGVDPSEVRMSIEAGLRVLSSYALPTGQSVWVITEWDRSATTILVPDDSPCDVIADAGGA